MSKTKAQLQEENEALRAALAAIGEGMPPLPEDDEKMRLYWMECASRLSMATAYAEGIAGCEEDWLAAYAQGHAADFRQRWARPLHYEPEANAMPVTPDPDACKCGHPGAAHIFVHPSPCTKCGCKEFGAAVTEPDALVRPFPAIPLSDEDATAIAEDAVAIIAESIRTGQPVITGDDDPPGNPPRHASALDPWCAAVHGDGDFMVICNSQAHHDGPDHVAWAADDSVVTRWAVTVTAPAVEDCLAPPPHVSEGITGLHWDNLSSSGGPA